MTISTAKDNVENLGRDFPEWKPWLAVVEAALRESANPCWERFVPEPHGGDGEPSPLLCGCRLSLDLNELAEFCRALLRIGCRENAAAFGTFSGGRLTTATMSVLLAASLNQDGARLAELAGSLGIEAGVFQAVAALVPVPLLHACRRRWSRLIPEAWLAGYCPVCGAWPAFAEVRGIDRSRYFRCGRCAAEWPAHCLFCPYCGTTDHKQLESLIPEDGASTKIVEACKHCLGYVKTFNALQATEAAAIMIKDFETVDLDLAALEQGYRRPPDTGYALDVEVVDRSTLRRKILG